VFCAPSYRRDRAKTWRRAGFRVPLGAVNETEDKPSWRRRLKLWIKAHRRAGRARLSAWLARRRGTPKPCGRALDRPPQTILICRLNKRLGNTLFVTPLIQSLAATFPRAEIDVLVMDPAHVRLLHGLPGLREIVYVPRKPLALLGFVFRFRRRRYDLAIDPNGNSSSNRTAISLARSRHKLGFAGDDQWVRLTHAATFPDDEPHQARQPVRLLQEGLPGTEVAAYDRLRVVPDDAAREAADRALVDALGHDWQRPVVGFFALATGDKQLPADWWRQWATAMRAGTDAPGLIQVVPPRTQAGMLPDLPVAAFAELDRLAALIGRLDHFVAADSGPMHLAAAAGTPTVGLFRATPPGDYAPLGRDCLALGADSLDPERVAQLVRQRLRAPPGQAAGEQVVE